MDWGAIIAGIIAGGVSGTAALFLLPKTWAEGKIKSVFDRELEAFKTKQAQIIEAAKLEISASLDRRTRLHSREFEVVPTIWELATVACSRLQSLCSRGRSYNRLGRDENVPRLQQRLRDEGLSELEIENVVQASTFDESERQYWVAVDRARAFEASKALSNFRQALTTKVIFVRDPLFSQFERLDKMAWSAWIEHRLTMEPGMPNDDWTNREIFYREINDVLESMAKGIRTGMWGADLTAEGELAKAGSR